MNADILPSIPDVRSLCRSIAETAGMDPPVCESCIFFENCRAALRRTRRAQRKVVLDHYDGEPSLWVRPNYRADNAA